VREPIWMRKGYRQISRNLRRHTTAAWDIAGLAAFVAALPGAADVDVAAVKRKARDLCPQRIARYTGDDPKKFAEEIVDKMFVAALAAQQAKREVQE
jgi:hypothetical protein